MKSYTIELLKKFIDAYEKDEDVIFHESDGIYQIRLIKHIINVMEWTGEKVDKYKYHVNEKYSFVINTN